MAVSDFLWYRAFHELPNCCWDMFFSCITLTFNKKKAQMIKHMHQCGFFSSIYRWLL